MSGSKTSDTLDPDGLEKATSPALSPPSIDERALIRRVDRKVLPMLLLIYIAAFLDRVNIGNALTLRLPEDLHLKGDQRNVALTIFFVPYVLFEIPSNILMKRSKPHIWLSCCILAFGVVMIAQGFVKTYGGLLTTRFFLGFAEAGIFPGSYYLISFWYKREEAQRRFTIYWCSVLIATAFGGLLASAIANMDGVRGYSSWRWVFILEGIGTVIVGIGAFFLVADFPEEARWLTEVERSWIMARSGTDKEMARKIVAKDLVRFFSDIKNLLGGIIYFATVIPIYSFAYFAPTIIRTLGYSTVQTQLHTVPPVAAALALALIFAYFSDRTRLRSPYLACCFCVTIVGLAILISVHDSFSAQYGGINLIAMGAFSGGPIILCWFVMNLQGHVERSIGTAWIIGFGNTGGIVATFLFLTKDAPRYTKGYSVCIALTVVGLLAVILYGSLVWRENKKLKVASQQREVVYNSL